MLAPRHFDSIQTASTYHDGRESFEPTNQQDQLSTMIGVLESLLTVLPEISSRNGKANDPLEPLAKHVVVCTGPEAAPIARALHVGKEMRIVEVRSGEVMGLSSLAVIRHAIAQSGSNEVTIVNQTVSPRLLQALCRESPGLAVNVLLPRAIRWKSGGFRHLQNLILLQQELPQLNLLSCGASMSSLVAKLGGKASDVELGLPRPHCRPPSGPVTLLIRRAPGEIPSEGHIAAAVALVKQRLGERITKIVVEAGATQARRILKTFACPAQKVPSLDKAIYESRGTPFILVGPYPDGMTDSLALLALESGGLAVVAKSALPLTGPLERWLTIDYWEQSDLICDRLCDMISNYEAVQSFLFPPCGAERRYMSARHAG